MARDPVLSRVVEINREGGLHRTRLAFSGEKQESEPPLASTRDITFFDHVICRNRAAADAASCLGGHTDDNLPDGGQRRERRLITGAVVLVLGSPPCAAAANELNVDTIVFKEPLLLSDVDGEAAQIGTS